MTDLEPSYENRSSRAAGVGSIESRDPRTGEVFRRYAATTPPDVAHALARARAAQPGWASAPVRERAAVLERFRRALYARRRDAAALIARETGKAPLEATATEVAVVLDFARFYTKQAPGALAPRAVRSAAGAHLRKRVHVVAEPQGTVAVISPWNYPLMLAAGHLLPALVAGNAALFKPAELTTATGELLVELLHGAGVPEAVLQLLPGAGETGAALVAAGCDKVFFTGSEATGRAIARSCAESLTPCVLELGGSDPAIVLADAPLETAAKAIVWGRFSNAGQTCVAPKRVFVVDAVHDRFVALVAREVQALHVGGTGPDAEVGPPVTERQLTGLRGQLDDAVARGATVIVRAEVPASVPPGAVPYFAPTVLEGAPDEARVMREETFGPILPLVRVRDADEAVRRANASSFGLNASVWSMNDRRARDVALRLHAGAVTVNDVLVAAGMAEVPHGGVKSSGIGRAHGLEGLHECIRTKTIIEDRLPGRPQPWWFRYSAAVAAGFDRYLALEHAPSLTERLRGLAGMGWMIPRLRRPRT